MHRVPQKQNLTRECARFAAVNAVRHVVVFELSRSVD